jgi:signal transduction histidine kinase/ActR/RegA family two-component response regulator
VCDVLLRTMSATVFIVDPELRVRCSLGVLPLRRGLSHDDVVGMSAEEYLAPDRLHRLPLLRSALQGNTVNFPAIRKGIAEYDVTVSPLEDSDGSVVGIIIIQVDVTERNHALRDRDDRLSLVVNQLPAFLWTTDRDLRVTELLGEAAHADDLTPIGVTLREFWGPDDPVGAVDVHERALAGESVSDENTRGGRTLVSQLEPLRNPAGEVIGVVGVAFDVTTERRLHHELVQAQRMEAVGQLTGGIAHDFNNMLTVIAGYTDLARSLEIENEELNEALAAIASATGASASLTRQLLAFGRQQVLQPRNVDLNEIVSRMIGLLSRLLGDNVVVEQDLAAGLGAVFADPSQVEQVIANLAINARDAMTDGGRLVIRTSETMLDAAEARAAGGLQPGPHVVLLVKDTGVGMDAATLERVFEPFFTTKEPGTGLGLATVYGIVKQSGGGIQVESEPGAGTTFRIYLPLVDAPVEREPPAPAAAELSRSPLDVLLVEDDPRVRELVRQLLARVGHDVTAAGTPSDALTAAGVRRFDLVLTDYLLPEMDGLQVIDRLRGLYDNNVAVVLMSGWAPTHALHHAPPSDEFVFLRKPFDAAELDAAIAEAVARRRR